MPLYQTEFTVNDKKYVIENDGTLVDFKLTCNSTSHLKEISKHISQIDGITIKLQQSNYSISFIIDKTFDEIAVINQIQETIKNLN